MEAAGEFQEGPGDTRVVALATHEPIHEKPAEEIPRGAALAEQVARVQNVWHLEVDCAELCCVFGVSVPAEGEGSAMDEGPPGLVGTEFDVERGDAAGGSRAGLEPDERRQYGGIDGCQCQIITISIK